MEVTLTSVLIVLGVVLVVWAVVKRLLKLVIFGVVLIALAGAFFLLR